jgi:putative FmdB family regulatory protein
MPLYEYKCEKCDSVFEVMQKFSDEPLSVHENCGGAVRRLLSAPAFQFKGSGWYITDYARGKGGDSNGSTKAESPKSESTAKTESSSDSKTSGSSTSTSSDKSA